MVQLNLNYKFPNIASFNHLKIIFDIYDYQAHFIYISCTFRILSNMCMISVIYLSDIYYNISDTQYVYDM